MNRPSPIEASNNRLPSRTNRRSAPEALPPPVFGAAFGGFAVLVGLVTGVDLAVGLVLGVLVPTVLLGVALPVEAPVEPVCRGVGWPELAPCPPWPALVGEPPLLPFVVAGADVVSAGVVRTGVLVGGRVADRVVGRLVVGLVVGFVVGLLVAGCVVRLVVGLGRCVEVLVEAGLRVRVLVGRALGLVVRLELGVAVSLGAAPETPTVGVGVPIAVSPSPSRTWAKQYARTRSKTRISKRTTIALQMRNGTLGRSCGGSPLCANGFRFLRSSGPAKRPYAWEMGETPVLHPSRSRCTLSK